jgi:signal transduction histidine kinase
MLYDHPMQPIFANDRGVKGDEGSSSGQRFLQATTVLLFVGLIALFCIVGMTVWLGQRADNHLQEIIAARSIRTAAVETRNALQTAEASQRGYLLTDNEIYLAPYGTSKIIANRRLGELAAAVKERPELNVPVKRLRDLFDEKFREMDATINLKRSRKDAEALAIVRTNRGKRSTDEANVFFSGIILAADDRLTTGGQEQSGNAQLLRRVSFVGALVILLVTAAAIFAVSRYSRTLAEASEEVRELNRGLEKRVADRTAHLAQINEEVQRFAYIVSHDLRAPLVNIMGFTSELEQSLRTVERALTAPAGAANDELVREAVENVKVDVPEAIGFIRSSTTKMDSLINAILKLSREGSRRLLIEDLDPKAIVDATLAALRHQLQSADGTVNLDIRVSKVFSDRMSLEQILSNILENAIKYRSRQRQLRIDVRMCRMPSNELLIEIADNGRGIAEENLERVFELFRRSGMLDQPGEGIGLAHVRALVRNLKGDVTLTSEPDAGTTISIRLPNLHSNAEART